MTSAELYDESIERLGRGDEAGLAEMLKLEAASGAEVLETQIAAGSDAGSAEEQVQTFLAGHDEVNEHLLAVAFPAIEYGSERVILAVKRAVAHAIIPSHEIQSGSALRPFAAAVMGGRVLWGLATYALTCERTDALAVLDGITMWPPYEEGDGVRAYVRREFRYPRVLGQSATNSYENYRTWLQDRPLVGERLPLFAKELDARFAEADLLLALRMIAGRGRKTYSAGAGPPQVRRLAARFRDPNQRPGLARLFETTLSELDQVVEDCYRGQLDYDRDRFWDELPPTFLVDDEE